jgi:hypothetical protein
LAACATPSATLVVRGARIRTLDADRPRAEALAVVGERIVAVGSDRDGACVLPGFVDAHVHFTEGGFSLSRVDLREAASEEEFGERLRAHSSKLPPGAWILGGNWDHDRWPGARLPTAALVDRYVPDRPVWVNRYDGHMSVANMLALRLAGVGADTPDPDGGTIVRMPGSREPGGVLKDAAQDLVQRVVPPPSISEIEAALRAAATHAASLGVTTVQDMGTTPAEFRALQRLARRGELPVRAVVYFPLSRFDTLEALGVEAGLGDDRVRIGGIKAFADGSLGSSTALFFEPYDSDPSTSGLRVTPLEDLEALVARGVDANLPPAIHAIGDRAVSEVLSVYEAARRHEGGNRRRLRIEHAQHLAAGDFERFARAGVVASLQPYHAIDDGRWADGRIGPERCARSYAWRSFLDAGAPLAFGSDWPVAPLDPRLGLEAAVLRRTLDGANPGGWFPEQRTSLEEAIRAYTLGAAYAASEERSRGSLEPGKLADFVVLARDPFDALPDSISDIPVLLTVVGGAVVSDSRR